MLCSVRRETSICESRTSSPPLVASFFMRGRMGGMKYRKLRIAWSVVWVLIYLALPATQPGYGPRGPRPWLTHERYWLLTIPTLALIGLAWLPQRFSLRTLLIVTTLVAVALGVAAYAVRK
jgi:hypothetical protein